MPSVLVSILGGVSVLVGVAIIVFALGHLRFAYRIYTNELVPVRELPTHSGVAGIEGAAAVADDTLAAPFSATDCLAYEYETQELQASGAGEDYSEGWTTLEQGRDVVPFLVEDDTGAVPVDPRGADLSLETHTTTVKHTEELPERIAQAMATPDDTAAGPETSSRLTASYHPHRHHRFLERRLDVGEVVFVYGPVARPAAGEWRHGRVDAIIRADDHSATFTSPFVVSDTTERGTAWRLCWEALSIAFLGLFWVGLTLLVVRWLG